MRSVIVALSALATVVSCVIMLAFAFVDVEFNTLTIAILVFCVSLLVGYFARKGRR